jgi:hypothetical protein
MPPRSAPPSIREANFPPSSSCDSAFLALRTTPLPDAARERSPDGHPCRSISDPAALQAICELADEFDMTAEEVEKRHHIRERAHELWRERDRPEGRDVEFWLAAEREVESQHERRRHA